MITGAERPKKTQTLLPPSENHVLLFMSSAQPQQNSSGPGHFNPLKPRGSQSKTLLEKLNCYKNARKETQYTNTIKYTEMWHVIK